jgi:hypothetical protein
MIRRAPAATSPRGWRAPHLITTAATAAALTCHRIATTTDIRGPNWEGCLIKHENFSRVGLSGIGNIFGRGDKGAGVAIWKERIRGTPIFLPPTPESQGVVTGRMGGKFREVSGFVSKDE